MSRPDEHADATALMHAAAEGDRGVAEVVRPRFGAGLSIEQTANALGIAPVTVTRRWTFGRARLYRAIGRDRGA